MKKQIPSLLGIYSLAVFGLQACALSNGSQSVSTVCNIPADQKGTIIGQWPSIPIPIALQQGAFASNEITQVTGAADIWNKFFSVSKGSNSLNYGSGSSISVSQAVNPSLSGDLCSQGIVQNGQFSGNIVIYKDSKWPTAYPKEAMAITKHCFLQGSPYKKIYMASIELNYQYFFVQGTKIPDLITILTHELGHLHGLDHSCEGFAKSGFPNCSDKMIDSDYLSASMYPSFNFDSYGNGEQRRNLGTNDQERVNCLYTGTASNSTSNATTK